jgi:hypothetical protein
MRIHNTGICATSHPQEILPFLPNLPFDSLEANQTKPNKVAVLEQIRT